MLISEWKSALKMWSVQAMGLLGTSAVIWENISEPTRVKVLETLPISPATAVALASAITIFLRLFKQKSVSSAPGNPGP